MLDSQGQYLATELAFIEVGFFIIFFAIVKNITAKNSSSENESIIFFLGRVNFNLNSGL